MRNPTIHIHLSTLIDLMGKMEIPNPEGTAMQLMRMAVPFSIRNRFMVSGDAKVRKSLTRTITAAAPSDMTAERFNRILNACRLDLQHKNISPIRQGTKDFTLLREITSMACEFCDNTGIESREEGCKIFITLGLQKMKYGRSYGLSKFKYYENDIYKAYDSLDMISTDPKPRRTRKFYDCYTSLLAEYAGIERDYSDNPEDYVCFIYARLEADRVGADIEIWMRAQFEELQRFADAIPAPNQLFSDNALKRYYGYAKATKKQVEEEVPDWDESKSTFAQKYAEKMREKYADK